MNDIIFAYRYFIILLIPIVLIFIYIYTKKNQKGYFLPTFKIFYNSKKRLFSIDNISLIFKFLILTLLVITIMRPQQIYTETKEEKEVIDIFILVDISLSMMAEDISPNRMEAAKKAIQKFLVKINNERIGLIIFAGIAFVQVPLTFDVKIIYDFVSRINIDTINQKAGLDGTAIGDAIFTAVERMKNNKTKNKVIILLTDGEANKGANPIVAAQYAKEHNIKIYTIGIGDPNGAIIPTFDPSGRKTYLIGPDGQPLKTTINIKSLQEIADMTGGKFFMVIDNQGFENAFNEINNLEKTKIKINQNIKYYDLYQYPLILAIFLLIIDYLWFERKKIL